MDDSSSRSERPTSVLAAAPWLALVVLAVALLELVLHFVFAHRAPRPEEWAKARPVVESMYTEGTVVSVAPYWAEPVARWKLGDRLMPLRDVARPDASRYSTAIEISAMGDRDPELAGWAIERAEKVGRLVVRRLRQQQPPSVRYVFTDHLEPPVEVSLAGPGGGAPCPYTTNAQVSTGNLSGHPPFPAARFSCSGRADQFMGITIIDDGEARPRRCIWAYAPGGQQEMVARFPGVPLGDVIQGYASTHYMYDREATSSFYIRILVDGEEIGRVYHHDGQGWSPFKVELGSRAGRPSADVELRVGGPSRPACLEADTR
jgi:hypothetical protein